MVKVNMALQTRRPGQDSDTDSVLGRVSRIHGPVGSASGLLGRGCLGLGSWRGREIVDPRLVRTGILPSDARSKDEMHDVRSHGVNLAPNSAELSKCRTLANVL